jgi:DNA-binding MarR family transcriptional regulator
MPARQRRNEDIGACACFNARNAARAITDLYDRVLEPCGLRVTQFAILVAIHGGKHGEAATMQDVAAGLALDPSTMTRTLRPLVDEGIVEIRAGGDRRAKILVLTKKGSATLAEGHALWRKAQAELRTSVGAAVFERLLGDLQKVSKSLRNEPPRPRGARGARP